MDAMPRVRCLPGLALLAALLTGAGVLAAGAQDEAFPRTKNLGRAAAEYRDDTIHVAAAYYYSQLQHESRWLLIETAIGTVRPMVIPRDGISLETPEGRDIPLASQERFGADTPRVRVLVQNASSVRHNVASYFNRRDVEFFRFFALPFEGIVSTELLADERYVLVGDLFFEAPTGLWDKGTYRLIVRGADARAELPIVLQ
jgi:hypothetical protein